MKPSHIKHSLRNMLVDGASIVIVLGIAFAFMQGFTILYTSSYNSGKLPSPADFQAAGYSFTGAISLIYMLNLTRKHRKEEENKETKTHTQTQTQTDQTSSQS